MPVISSERFSQPSEPKNIYQLLCTDAVRVVKPSFEGETVFRPIPELGPDGAPLPMVRSLTPAGPDFSAIAIEDCVIGAGDTVRFTGLTRHVHGSENSMEQIFPSIYIVLRSKQKKNELPAAIAKKATEYLTPRLVGKSTIPSTIIKRASTFGFMQGILLTLNGKTLEKPMPRCVIMMNRSSLLRLSQALTQAYEQQIDVFDPQHGRTITLRPLPPNPVEGRTIPVFAVSVGAQPMPIPDQVARKLWVPWQQAFRFYTRDEMLRHAVACYGADIVAAVYPNEVAALVGSSGQSPPAAPQPSSQERLEALLAHTPELQHAAKPADVPPVAPVRPQPPVQKPAPVPPLPAVPVSSPEELMKKYEALLDDIGSSDEVMPE